MREHRSKDVAVVGIALRVPGAQTPEMFWRHVAKGTDCLTRLTVSELRAAGVKRETLSDPRFVAAAPMLPACAEFDADLFGMTAYEAERTDPAHRLFLECCFEALEHAAIIPAREPLRIGVIAGSEGDYARTKLQDVMRDDPLLLRLGADVDFVATRVAHKLDLTGPSMSAMAACATSLLAVHLGVASLRRGECDVVLAGGAAISVDEMPGYISMDDGMRSPSGRIRPFDESADGTIFGSGVAVVVLRPLADALAACQPIYGVIRGSAVSNDGNPPGKKSFVAPSLEGQIQVIEEALKDANVRPETIGFLEAHGTATRLGDPTEVAALSEVYGRYTDQVGFCGLGAVKANFGHLRSAAGAVSLISACLALTHGVRPPVGNLMIPNPRIKFAASPFFVARTGSEWPKALHPRRAAVSSFGFGGVNAHVVLEAGPPCPLLPARGPNRAQLCFVSANSPAALERRVSDLADHVEAHPNTDIADLAYTLRCGRKAMSHRAVFRVEPDNLLRAFREPPRIGSTIAQRSRDLIFLLPGQGSQYAGMGRRLYETAETFRDAVDRCAELLAGQIGCDIRELMFSNGADNCRDAGLSLLQTANAQPALFVIEYAMAQQLSAWGVKPTILLGHSIGEITAACLSGVFSLSDGLAIVAARGRLMQNCEPGAMLAVLTGAEVVRPLLPEGVEIAAINAPELTVIAGPHEPISAAERLFDAHGIASRHLKTSHAFHSWMTDPALPEFRRVMAGITLHAPQVPVISNLTGEPLTDAQACDPDYWAEQIRRPVMFSAGIQYVLAAHSPLFVEVGPGGALSGVVRHHDDEAITITSLEDGRDEECDATACELMTARLWQYGATLGQPPRSENGRRRMLALPTYPFQRYKFEIEKGRDATVPEEPLKLYTPVWDRQALPDPKHESAQDFFRPWLCLCDDTGLGEALVDRLITLGETVFRVYPDQSFRIRAEHTLGVRPASVDDFAAALRHIVKATTNGRKAPAVRILDLWTVTGSRPDANTIAGFQVMSRIGHDSLIALVQAAHLSGFQGQLEITLVADGVFCLPGEELDLQSDKTGVLGPARYIPLELPDVSIRVLDVAGTGGDAVSAWAVDGILAEARAAARTSFALLRQNGRYGETLAKLPELPVSRPRLRWGGTVFITGGVGGIALEVASDLFEQSCAKLVLTTRWPVPEEHTWPERARVDDRVGRALAKVVSLRDQGAEILLVSADVGNFTELKSAYDVARERFGRIDAVIHAAGATTAVLALDETPAVSPLMFGKVLGAYHLERLFADQPLDFFVHFSSQVTHAGAFGQSVYAGANWVLNALAQRRRASCGGFTCAIGWGAWKQVGMAANFLGSRKPPASTTKSAVMDDDPHIAFNHPLIQKKRVHSATRTVYSGDLLYDRQWVVDAHRFRGRRLLAGVVHVECMRAVAVDYFGPGSMVELAEVSFIEPLFVDQHGIEIEIHITKDTSSRVFAELRSKAKLNQPIEQGWIINSTAELRTLAERPPSLSASLLELSQASDATPGIAAFGGGSDILGTDRWACQIVLAQQDPQTLARLWVSDERADPSEFGLYPPLLDQGTACRIDPRHRGGFIPTRIRSVRIYGRMGLEVIVLGRDSEGIKGRIDVAFYGPEGEPLVEYEGYERRPIEQTSLYKKPVSEISAAGVAPARTNGAIGASRRLRVGELGDLESIGLQTHSPPAPARNEVQIRVLSAGLNFRDVLTALGRIPAPSTGELELGGECSGYIHAIGHEVRGFQVGDAVVAMGRGCFASFVNVTADLVLPIPERLVMEDAGGIPIVFLTADRALRRLARVQPGDRVLIHAAAGGVGLAAVQIARSLGAEVLATAGRQEKHDYLHSIGVEHVFSSRSLDFADGVREVTDGEGVDVILNSLAGDFIPASLDLLKPHGRFVEIGKRDILDGTRVGLAPFIKNLTFSALDLSTVALHRPKEVGDDLEALLARFAKEELVSLPTTLLEFDDVASAFDRMARAEHIGKIVVKIGEHTDRWRGQANAFAQHFGRGIAPRDGRMVLRRLISSDAAPTVVIAVPMALSGAASGHSSALQIDQRQRNRPDLTSVYRAASTPEEEALIALWENVMRIDGIGVDDDFFDLGGDSIVVMRILFRVFREFGVRLPSSIMAEHTTVSSLAQQIVQRRETAPNIVPSATVSMEL